MSMEQAHKVLKDVWGFESFRLSQEAVRFLSRNIDTI